MHRNNLSIIWRGFLEVLPIIKENLHWLIGSGQLSRVGVNRIVGVSNGGHLSDALVQHFHDRGFFYLEHFCTHHSDRGYYWLNARYFRLTGSHKEEWSSYLESLNRAGIVLNHAGDKLVWAINSLGGSVTVKAAYDHLIGSCSNIDGEWWAHSLWHWHMPTKLKCFFWLVIFNRTLTWDNLRRRGWTGPGICVLCRKVDEDLQHLFFHCCFALKIWRTICTALGMFW